MRDADDPAPGEGLHDPLPADLHALLRRAVLDHVTAERRRDHVPVLHVGVPGDAEAVWADSPDDPGDHALRADIVAALLARVRTEQDPARRSLVWLTRPGELDLQDVDARWLAAARTAYAEVGAPLTLVVVNRHGWRDPRSGLSRQWRRLRQR